VERVVVRVVSTTYDMTQRVLQLSDNTMRDINCHVDVCWNCLFGSDASQPQKGMAQQRTLRQ